MSLADELLNGWAPILKGVELASGTRGRFEVTLDGDVIFSKESLQRHANAGEVSAEVERRLGPRLDWRRQ